jgi:hypothetical protein
MRPAREGLSAQSLHVKFECSDGETGHNQSHGEFVREWHQVLFETGLAGALEESAGRDAIVTGDFMHLVTTFLNRV